MTMANDDNDPEPPVVAQVQAQAQQIVESLSTYLQALGWDAIMISLTRRVDVGSGDAYAPGATATIIDAGRCGPVIAQLAEVLRKQADMLEANAVKGDEAAGYIHDQSDHRSGFREWPK